MSEYAEKPKESQVPLERKGGQAPEFTDNRPEALIQKEMQRAISNSPRAQQLNVYGQMAGNAVMPVKAFVRKKANSTGLPDGLKSGIEGLSGHSMDDVKVHYNSAKPAQLQAHAYARGSDIHIAPGQEKHLPHEAWHVVQQKQGRVKPTLQMKGTVNVNDDAGLEKEADVMGKEAMQFKNIVLKTNLEKTNNGNGIVQRVLSDYNEDTYKREFENLKDKKKEDMLGRLASHTSLTLTMSEALEFIKNPPTVDSLTIIEDPKIFIAKYSIITGDKTIDWPQVYFDCKTQLDVSLHDIDLDSKELQKVREEGKEEVKDYITSESKSIEKDKKHLIKIKGHLEEFEKEAKEQSKAFKKAIETPQNEVKRALRSSPLKSHTVIEENLKTITNKMGALLKLLTGPLSHSPSAKGRAHEDEGIEDTSGSNHADTPYQHITIGDRQVTKKFVPKDKKFRAPNPKSVFNIPGKDKIENEKMKKEHIDVLKGHKYINDTISRLSKPETHTKSYTGQATKQHRGAGQSSAMGGFNAATYAVASGLLGAENFTDWEWLHIQGAGLGGNTVPQNLLPGTFDANTLMIPFESNLKTLSRYASHLTPLKVTYKPEGQIEALHAYKFIVIKWDFEHPKLSQQGEAKFDTYQGRVTTKGDIEVLEGFLEKERESLIEPKKQQGTTMGQGASAEVDLVNVNEDEADEKKEEKSDEKPEASKIPDRKKAKKEPENKKKN